MTLDVFFPLSKAPRFLDWLAEEVDHYPIWVVPYRRVRDYEWVAERFYRDVDDELLVDLAVYGLKPRGGESLHRLFERKLAELGGMKTLIDHNFYSPEEFWESWNKPNYDRAKAVTDPANIFRDLYTKTCRAAMGTRG